MNHEDFGAARVPLMRTTVFFRPPKVPTEAIFKTLTGTEPNRTTRDNSQAIIIEEGRHPHAKGVKLRIVQHGERIDVVVEASENAAPTNINDITLVAEVAHSAVTELAEKLFLKYSEIVRVAFAANFVFSDEKISPELVAKQKLAHLVGDLTNSSEFSYKINRRTEIDGIAVNRLSTWEISHCFVGQIGVQGTPTLGVPVGAMTIRLPGKHLGEFLTLEVECNTDAARTTAIESTKLVPIYEKLIAESAKIVKMGHT